MTSLEIDRAIHYGAHDRVRQYLKKLSILDRVKKLHEVSPFIKSSPQHTKFFRDHFAKELAALAIADWQYEKAVQIYNTSKNYRRI